MFGSDWNPLLLGFSYIYKLHKCESRVSWTWLLYNQYGSERWSGSSLCHFSPVHHFWKAFGKVATNLTSESWWHQCNVISAVFQIWSTIGEVMVQGHHIPMLMTPPPRRDPAQNISRRCLSLSDLTPYKTVIPHQEKVGNVRRVRSICIYGLQYKELVGYIVKIPKKW